MRLQEVLKEREAEIQILETSLKETKDVKEGEHANGRSTPANEDHALTNGSAGPTVDTLSPKTLNQFDHIRKSMEVNGNGHVNGVHDTESDQNGSVLSDTDESLERLNELML